MKSYEEMKLFTILLLKFLLISDPLFAETIPTKSNILKQSSACIKDSQKEVCRELVSQIESLQLVLFDQSRFKCQSSLLGLQSEIIEAYFLNNLPNRRVSFMIPYVIKNC